MYSAHINSSESAPKPGEQLFIHHFPAIKDRFRDPVNAKG
jgi:hypothetical protein